MAKRVFLIVLDSLGIGALPDAARYGDTGANTLRTLCTKSDRLMIPNLYKLGLFNVDGVAGVCGEPAETPLASCVRLSEKSTGKDTTIGHWELSGVVSKNPLPVYPKGFPPEIIAEFEQRTGVGTLCNKPYSGTEVIKDYGQEHIDTGKLIVYTSADSVFQIAAHEEHFGLEKLYAACEIARELLLEPHGVGRVIARPFKGENPNFVRTENRHDYSLTPPEDTMMDILAGSGKDVIAVGKISDIFGGRGVTKAIKTKNNADGMAKTMEMTQTDFHGLCFVNLVDFDMVYGHRNDIDGYAEALSAFDMWLGKFLTCLKQDDLLIITADHGCDPGHPGTDHSREYISALIYGKGKCAVNHGTQCGFDFVAKTVLQALLDPIDEKKLVAHAMEARRKSYSPYSGYKVGAALLLKSGEIVTGCNVENAAYTPTCCAERTAIFKAVSEGHLDFSAIAVVCGPGEEPEGYGSPCGVCRQVMLEFCDPETFLVIMAKNEDDFLIKTLGELVPHSFTPKDLE